MRRGTRRGGTRRSPNSRDTEKRIHLNKKNGGAPAGGGCGRRMWNRFSYIMGAVWHGELVIKRMFNDMPLDAGCKASQMLLKLAWLLFLLIYYGSILNFRAIEKWDEATPLFWFFFSLLGMSLGWYGLKEDCMPALALAEIAHHCTWTMAFSMCWWALHTQSRLTVAVFLLPIAGLSACSGVERVVVSTLLLAFLGGLTQVLLLSTFFAVASSACLAFCCS